MAGLFITLEGIDGCGKSTQGSWLAQQFTATGAHVIHTVQPGGTTFGQTVREVFLKHDEPLSGITELFLMAADRHEHVRRVIEPALAAGHVVICERYTDSTVAYQGYGRGIDLTHIRYVNELATGGLMPRLTLLFDLSYEIARARRSAGPDRIESETTRFFERVRQGYLDEARREPDRIRVIDASKSVMEVRRQIVMKLRQKGIDLGGPVA